MREWRVSIEGAASGAAEQELVELVERLGHAEARGPVCRLRGDAPAATFGVIADTAADAAVAASFMFDEATGVDVAALEVRVHEDVDAAVTAAPSAQ